MQLYFRLLIMMIKLAFVRKYVSIFKPAVMHMRVLPNDLDFNKHMNNSRYLALMDLGRVYYMGQTGILREAIKKKWSPIVAEIDIRYKRSLDPFMKFQLITELMKVDEKFFYLKQSFVHKGNVMAEAEVKGLFISPHGKVSPEEVIRITQEDISKVKYTNR